MRIPKCRAQRTQGTARDKTGTVREVRERYKRGQNGDTQKRKRPDFRSGLVLNSLILVPEIGFEPTTYALRMRRSTN